MGKKKKSKKIETVGGGKVSKMFRKFAEKTIRGLRDVFGEDKSRYDGAIFLMKTGEDGVSFVEGSPEIIAILLGETADRDPDFAKVIKKVAKNLKKPKLLEGDGLKQMLRENGIVLPEGTKAFELGEINPDEMDDDAIESLINKIVKDARNNFNGNQED